jgi:nucleotide-binding universal stress UspA family protein
MPKQIETILFASNLTETSRTAFRTVAQLAGQLNAKIMLLHVIEKVPESYESRLKGLFGESKWNEILLHHMQEAQHALIGKISERQMARTALCQFCQESDMGSPHDSAGQDQIIVIEGAVAETIVQQAQEHHCDLIALGASKGLLSSTSVGHNIKSVLKRSKVPTLVIPTAGQQ